MNSIRIIIINCIIKIVNFLNITIVPFITYTNNIIGARGDRGGGRGGRGGGLPKLTNEKPSIKMKLLNWEKIPDIKIRILFPHFSFVIY
jgi:hypothetical protein